MSSYGNGGLPTLVFSKRVRSAFEVPNKKMSVFFDTPKNARHPAAISYSVLRFPVRFTGYTLSAL